MDYEFLVMLGIQFLCFYIKTKYGIIFLIFWLFISVFGFFCTSNALSVYLEDLNNLQIIYKFYEGNYEDLFKEFPTFHKIRKKFSLPEIYSPFGIFYDNPDEKHNKNNSKNRAIVGLIVNKEEKEKIKFKDEDLINYLKDQGFKTGLIKETKCVAGSYYAFFSVKYSFNALTKLYIKLTNIKFFTRVYNPKWKETKMKTVRKNYRKKCGVLEIYEHKEIKMYLPYE
ncbi:MAG: hypothetical protein MJ252_10755, partial [archaeon]|nr:hypothetical protein [archaeon]